MKKPLSPVFQLTEIKEKKMRKGEKVNEQI